MNVNLLEIRKELKERKPVFIRQDNPKRRKLNYKWRKPKGIHSKIRHKFKGRRKMPSPGYKSPAKIRGFHSSGLSMELVSSAGDLQNIKKESGGIIISKRLGLKKKLQILKKAQELGIAVLNLNASEQINKIEEFMKSKKKKTVEEKKKEAVKDIKKDKKPEERQLSDEERKQADKEEKDRILTKKT